MNLNLFLAIIFLTTFVIGHWLEKIKIPWIFAALLLGTVLSIHNPFINITSSATFDFLANLGMYFLLFIIGFEINIKEINNKKSFIFKSMLFIMALSTIIGGVAIYFLFDVSWIISFIVAASFATVGEEILLPILDEFKMINSNLGQIIIGIGTLDDIIEVLILILVMAFIGSNTHGGLNILLIILSLLALFAMTFALSKLKKRGRKFKVSEIETLFLFIIGVLFLFLGIGQYAEATALGAILAGVGLRNFIPQERLKVVENEIKSVCYGLFAPIFFVWVGISIDMKYLTTYPLLILAIIIITSIAKYWGSYIVAKKELGWKQSILLGTGLSVKFSTSIVIIKILFDNKIIKDDLYSVIVASSIIFAFIIPILFLGLLKKYKKEIN